MKNFVATMILFSVSITFCLGQIHYGKPDVNPNTIQQNFTNWSKYQSENIMLSRDFIALDTNSKVITKDAFINELILGTYIPIQLESKDSLIYYKLFKISVTADSNIKATIMQSAFEEYQNFKMEGLPFPEFSFTNLNGHLISNETMKGKIIVIKCWYIHCPACIKEFPDVNKLVEKYKDRKDILFVSLAEDTPEQLQAFLANKSLSYAVVPNMKMYMNETLHLNAFPTHFIINKQGLIAKVLPNYESLKVALEKESR